MLSRVVLAVDVEELRVGLARHLRRCDALVTSVPMEDPLPAMVDTPCDVLVASESRLPQPVRASLEMLAKLPEPPSIILLIEHEDEEQRALLLASGASAVLQSSLPAPHLYAAVESILGKARATRPNVLGGVRVLDRPRLADFVSNSPSMQAFMNVAQRVVRSDTSLLILGETGVGKERLALALHSESGRSGGPFLPINCAALPEHLLESELFGHEQGAFTGATRTRRGAFELSHRGTIFLDEVGDMPLALQAKLLRVLQDRSFLKVGGEKPIHVDVRVMAATNRDLATMVEEGRFRRDLYYRLSVVTLLIPPLRERREDIPELVQSYLAYLAPRIGTSVDSIRPETLEALLAYSWPGNVRELINVLERAMLLCDGGTIALKDLPDEIGTMGRAPSGSRQRGNPERLFGEEAVDWISRPWRDVRQEVLDRAEKTYLAALLEHAGGRIGETARRAGLTTRALHLKMKHHSLKKEAFRTRG